jgi:hypothetical protein
VIFKQKNVFKSLGVVICTLPWQTKLSDLNFNDKSTWHLLWPVSPCEFSSSFTLAQKAEVSLLNLGAAVRSTSAFYPRREGDSCRGKWIKYRVHFICKIPQIRILILVTHPCILMCPPCEIEYTASRVLSSLYFVFVLWQGCAALLY